MNDLKYFPFLAKVFEASMAYYGEEQQAMFDALTEKYTEEALELLQSLRQPLTTARLSQMVKSTDVAKKTLHAVFREFSLTEQPTDVAETLRTVFLGLTRLRMQNITQNGLPFTRVDPAVIEEAFLKLTVRELLPNPDLQDAVFITINVAGDFKNIGVTITPDGAVKFVEGFPVFYVNVNIKKYVPPYSNVYLIGNAAPNIQQDYFR
jgi:hypothetical protein